MRDIIKIFRGSNEIFTPAEGGQSYAYSLKGNPIQVYNESTWLQAVEMLKGQKEVRIIYYKPFNKEDWL